MFNAASAGTRCTRAAAVTFTEKYCTFVWLYDFLINPLRSIKNDPCTRSITVHRSLKTRGDNLNYFKVI